MERIAALSDEIQQANAKARGTVSFSDLLNAALAELEPRDRHVDRKIEKVESGLQRALLLTTAMLHGARPDTIHHAATELLKLVEHPREEGSPIQHPPLSSRLRAIEASPGRDRLVRFEEPGYDRAVRTHFWDNFPWLRPHLHDWLAGAAQFPALSSGERLMLVTRYAHECLRTGPPEDLSDLVTGWTESSASQAELSMAARALGDGVIHPRYGSHFRRKIYDWSREPRLKPARAHVLIGVCSEALSVTFPDQALTRLLHISHCSGDDVRHSAREALLRITSSDDRLYRSLLGRLTPGQDRTDRHDAEFFLQLADPVRLLAEEPLRAQLTAHWAVVLGGFPDTTWAEALGRWLDAAGEQEAARGPVLGILAAACAQRGTALSSMYVIACGWASADDTRKAIVDDLLHRTTAALGLGPLTRTA